MATFYESGKEINDLFTRNFPLQTTLEVNFRPHPDQFSVSLRGNFKGDLYDGTVTPIYRYRPWGLEAIAQISSPDDDDKTLDVNVGIVDSITPGFVGNLSYINGRRGEVSIGGIYKHLRFGGVTAKLGLPVAASKYISASIQIENQDTNGFGIGATAKTVFGGDVFLIDTWKTLLSYKAVDWNGYFGLEQKPEAKTVTIKKVLVANEEAVKVPEASAAVVIAPPSNNLCVVGGLLKHYDFDRTFAVMGSYNISREATSFEFLFRKIFEDSSFFKIKADCAGKIHTSRQYNVSHGTITVGTEADVCQKTGSVSVAVSTNF